MDLVARVGARVRSRLGVSHLSAAEQASVRLTLPSSPQSARAYSDGLTRLRVFDYVGARAALEQAVADDAGFALAHSALAEALMRSGFTERARREADRASELS